MNAWMADGLFCSEICTWSLKQPVFINSRKGHQPTKHRCSICMRYFAVYARQTHHSPAQKQTFQKRLSTSNINEPLVHGDPFSRRHTFHVWAVGGILFIFLKIPPMRHLFREMVFINDWNWIYIIGAVLRKLQYSFGGGGGGRLMHSLSTST
jgi:hypothetical protein